MYLSSAAVPEWTNRPLLPARRQGLIWLQAGNLGRGVMVRQHLGVGASGCHMTDPNPKTRMWGGLQEWGKAKTQAWQG